LATVLDRLGTRLAERLRSARQEQEVSRLVISAGEREAAVSLGNGRGHTLRLATPLSVAGQLLMGFRDVEEAVAAGDAEVEPAQLPTWKALLPAGCPFCWPHDHF
jgi:hypothetical protein